MWLNIFYCTSITINRFLLENGTETCNAHVTCNLACSAMKSLNPQIQLYASGIVTNISARNFGATQALGDIMEQLCQEEQPVR